jgi:hypothetical protein
MYDVDKRQLYWWVLKSGIRKSELMPESKVIAPKMVWGDAGLKEVWKNRRETESNTNRKEIVKRKTNKNKILKRNDVIENIKDIKTEKEHKKWNSEGRNLREREL